MQSKLYGTVLVKAQKIMDYIAAAEEAPTLNEISNHVDISKPTIYKILQTLEFCGYVAVYEPEKRYRLGTVFLRYAQSVNDSIDIMNIAKPVLKDLRDQTGETINLGIVDHNHITLLSKMESTSSIKLVSIVGGQMEMYSSAMGKAILAAYPHDQLERYFGQTDLKPLTTNTITNKKALLADLYKTRQQGYSVDNVENQTGVYCLGFPIIVGGKIYGAFSISTPKYRMTKQKEKKFVALGRQAQKKIIDLF